MKNLWHETRLLPASIRYFLITCLAIAVLASFGPAEHSLGTHIRVVYLHAAWVWVALGAFIVAAVFGALGLILQQRPYHAWSKAFGRTGIILWVTYLPLSLWAMQANWNGLFLAEPRWKLALVFAVTGIVLQIGISLINSPNLTSCINILYLVALMLMIFQTQNVMHPGSAILTSSAWRIQLFFFSLLILIFLAAFQIARWWYSFEPDRAK